ncbi:MAG: sigma-54 dependent transcriptional regulator [Thiobacillus sp.]|nr:sigma-54 dependent transcriptional regulator [Thiobacillus sp.]
MIPTLLIAEDDAALAKLAARVAEEAGFSVVVRHDGETARSTLETEVPDALLTDLRLPGCDGLELLRTSKALDPQRPVLLMTGYATPMTAIEAFRLGVSDILLKPFDLDVARAALVRLKSTFDQKARLLQLTEQVARSQDAAYLAAKSPAMQHALELAAQVADSPLPVLLEGETGVGKGVLARHIHALSPRAGGPFFTLHCGALPQTLLESELFGYEKGAFSGATARKPGLLELAAGGTLFLDEINSTSLDAQTRLLQFIQDKQVFRIGGVKPVKVDVRLIFASNQSLKERVRDGGLREDLYYRIAVFPITVPPLRERREDLADLAGFLLARSAFEMGRPALPLDADALARIQVYAWPGNVRELANTLQRALVLAQGALIRATDLPAELHDRPTAPACPWGESATLAEVESAWIKQALERCGGNRTQAAKMLGIDPSTLWRKLKGNES